MKLGDGHRSIWKEAERKLWINMKEIHCMKLSKNNFKSFKILT